MSSSIARANSLQWKPIDLDLAPDELAALWPVCTGFALLESTLSNADSWSVVAAFPTEIRCDRLPDWSPQEIAPRTDEAPFATGWIGYLAYESAPLFNPVLTTRAPYGHLPQTWWGRYDAALSFRHVDQTWQLGYRDNPDSRQAAARLLRTLRDVTAQPQAPVENKLLANDERLQESRGVELGTHEHAYHQSIETVLDWIGQGHIYQANYTYPMVARFEAGPRNLYRRLRVTNPAPYGAFLQTSREVAILSSSPEQFLRIDGRRIQTRPIKGTEARHADPERDRQLATSLLESEKDRAELTMIVDLERNDLGRVCEFGTVETHPFPVVESYQSVHHLVATVEGRLRKDVCFRDILAATFPGGSITGAPKVRAMEIIAELESRPRFIYTGALGYLDDRGTAELALTIRTLWTEGDRVHFDVGGGIVADSTAESEWEETHQKAAGMRRAIESLGWPSH